MTQQFPLQWPPGRGRNYNPKNSQFKTSLSDASASLYGELSRLGATNIVLSSNMKYREDGLPYSRQPNIEDTGVAVYFSYKGSQMCFACDQYILLKDNVQAIRKTIEAIRGIERWGSSDMMQQAFRGFEQLPAPGNDHWNVLKISKTRNKQEIDRAYRTLCKIHHPDNGGSSEEFAKLVDAHKSALEDAGC